MEASKKKLKMFKGTSFVLPAGQAKRFDPSRYTFQWRIDTNNRPQVIITPISDFFPSEDDPEFMHVIQAFYEDAMAHPEKLLSSEEVWEGVEELLDGVDIENEE